VPAIRVTRVNYATHCGVIHAIRDAVFVREQSVPEALERDDLDAVAIHVLAFADEIPAGTGRITVQGKIGRMAVLRGFRRLGVGRELLRALLVVARDAGLLEVHCSAQCPAVAFYEKMGFRAEGPVFEEAGIAHRRMRRTV
jgi:predicted GNAT family N-acyltransferase